MRIHFVQAHKSITDLPSIDLPDLTILTGANGAGKTHLLDAIKNDAVRLSTQETGDLRAPLVRHFSSSELVVPDEGPLNASQIRDRWSMLENVVRSVRMSDVGTTYTLTADEQEEIACRRVVSDSILSPPALARIKKSSRKRLVDFNSDDFKNYSPSIVGSTDPFAYSLASLLLGYSSRRAANEYRQWRAERGLSQFIKPLTDQEFVELHGPPPEEILDEVLKLVGLPYTIVAPSHEGETDFAYQARLMDAQSGLTFSPGELSSGEQTLLAIAASLYADHQEANTFYFPKLLLLDEPDSSLHPTMTHVLLDVLRDVFIGRHGMRVIATTHSPTTVALAPEESLYVVSRAGIPRLQKATRDQALSTLTVGIPTLSISIDNQRQVIVESEHDEACYQALFVRAQQHLKSGISLSFIAAGTSGSNGGCDAVKRLVRQFRTAGNRRVLGLVDKDGRQSAPEGIAFIADRYSIENLLLDPLLVGLLLLRDRAYVPSAMDVTTVSPWHSLVPGDAQKISDFVASKIALGRATVTAKIAYSGGFEITVPSEWLSIRGHDLESAIVEVFQPLRRYRQSLKLKVIENVIADVPDVMPLAALRLFEELATVAT